MYSPKFSKWTLIPLTTITIPNICSKYINYYYFLYINLSSYRKYPIIYDSIGRSINYLPLQDGILRNRVLTTIILMENSIILSCESLLINDAGDLMYSCGVPYITHLHHVEHTTQEMAAQQFTVRCVFSMLSTSSTFW